LLELAQVLGFDEIPAGAADQVFGAAISRNYFPAEKRTCIEGAFRDGLHSRFLQAVGHTFESEENVQAWLAFAKTPVGAKYAESTRELLHALLLGGTSPAKADLRARFSDSEMEEIRNFVRSPSGSVIRNLGINVRSAMDENAMAAEVANKCGISMKNDKPSEPSTVAEPTIPAAKPEQKDSNLESRN
jgi:hypothetical protein